MLIFEPLLGGLLIGFAVMAMLWGLGRVTGISGIFWQAITDLGADHSWRIAFVIGLVLGPFLLIFFGVHSAPNQAYTNPFMVILAGFLVGFGTRLGSGCTSGHGICGMARFSARSIIATMIFMLAGMATVALVRHVFA